MVDRGRVWALRVVIGALLCLPMSAAAQFITCDAGAKEVRAVRFDGNATFRAGDLADLIVTTQSDAARRWFRLIGQKYCADSVVIATDAIRLQQYYFGHGFREARVTRAVRALGKDAVEVQFVIDEGRPMMVDSLTVNGLDGVASRDRIVRDLPLRVGARYDRDAVEATRDSIARRLRNDGYPTAEVFRNVDTDTLTRRAVVWYETNPGPRMRLENIVVAVDSQAGRGIGISKQRVLSSLGIRRGQWFRERDLEGVKRGLYLSEAYRHVDVTVDSASLQDGLDTLVSVNIRLTEGDLRASRASIGWGNFECLRAVGSLTTLNFLGGLRRVDAIGRVSRIGAGVPFKIANGLCYGDVRDDDRADTLNYYVSATYAQPALFGRRTLPTLTLYSERRFEYPTYVRQVPFGLVASIQRQSQYFPMSFSYQVEYGATTAQPAYFCAVFNACDQATFAMLQERRRTAIIGWAVSRTRQDDVVNPSRGYTARFEVRHASPVVGSDPLVRFTRASFDATLATRLTDGAVLVTRLRAGTVLGARFNFTDRAQFVPPQERLYAGGPASVRGYGQNELGPIVYVVSGYDTLTAGGQTTFEANPKRHSLFPLQPTGGDNVIVANAELRLRSPVLPELIQYSVFADAGEVWNRTTESVRSSFRNMKVTPGIGVRVFTPIGPMRIDIALGPRELLAGPAYWRPSRLAEGQRKPVYCISPGNALPVTLQPGGADAIQVEGQCRASYDPVSRRNFWQRIRFQFGIGQAF